MLDPNPERHQRAVKGMIAPPVVFDDVRRQSVARAIEDHCRIRGWALHALAVRTNHVHAVISNAGVPPEGMMTELKTWATRRLRDAGLIPAGRKVWVHHGNTRYLWKAQSVEAATAYVELAQDTPR